MPLGDPICYDVPFPSFKKHFGLDGQRIQFFLILSKTDSEEVVMDQNPDGHPGLSLSLSLHLLLSTTMMQKQRRGDRRVVSSALETFKNAEINVLCRVLRVQVDALSQLGRRIDPFCCRL